ncbi:MAG: YwbE family protein [Candidatus Colwellbacteria bacterium]|nr:YwbE family protein [Candidatus Colwellbacteria bacterium]
MDGTERVNVKPGILVRVVQKQDQLSGETTEGIIKDILTNSSNHPRGIKVRLEDGTVGRVREIL